MVDQGVSTRGLWLQWRVVLHRPSDDGGDVKGTSKEGQRRPVDNGDGQKTVRYDFLSRWT